MTNHIPTGLCIPQWKIDVGENGTGFFWKYARVRQGSGRKYRWKSGYAPKYQRLIVFWKWDITVSPVYFRYRGGRVSSFLRLRKRILL